MPSCLIFVYEGCEPVEAFGTVDVLRRCGADVTVFGYTKAIKMGHGLVCEVDTTE